MTLWIPDSMRNYCVRCTDEFTFTNRRHHCRVCGEVVCGKCSTKKIDLLKGSKGVNHAWVRACDLCFKQLQLGGYLENNGVDGSRRPSVSKSMGSPGSPSGASDYEPSTPPVEQTPRQQHLSSAENDDGGAGEEGGGGGPDNPGKLSGVAEEEEGGGGEHKDRTPGTPPPSSAASTGALPPSVTLDPNRPMKIEEKGSPLIPYKPNIYEKELQKAYKFAVAAVEDEGATNGWRFNSRQEDIDIYVKPVSWSPIENCKGVGFVPAPPEVVAYVFADKRVKPEWDEMYDNGYDIERIDRVTSLGYAAYKAPWPVTPRDFCVVGRAERFLDGSIMVYASSVTHPKCGPLEKFVRGTLTYSVTLFVPVDGGKSTKVTYCVGSDPNGSIPKFLVNAASVKQPLCIANVRKLIMKKPDLIRQVSVEITKREEADKQTYGDVPKPTVPSTSSSSSSSSTTSVSSPPSSSSSSAAIVSSSTVSSSSSSSISTKPTEQKEVSLANFSYPPSPYDQAIARAYKEGWTAVSSKGETDGWKFNQRKDDIDIYTKEAPGMTLSKGIGEMPVSPQVANSVFADPKLRKKWDEMYESGSDFEELDILSGLNYSCFRGIWPVQGRDFVSVGRVRHMKDGSVFSWSTSVTHPAKPVVGNYVRGTLHYSAVYFERIGENATRVIYCVATDPNGSLPKWVVNIVNLKQPLCVAVIRKMLQNQPELITQAKQQVQKENAAMLKTMRQQMGLSAASSSVSSSSSSSTSSTSTIKAPSSDPSSVAAAAVSPAAAASVDGDLNATRGNVETTFAMALAFVTANRVSDKRVDFRALQQQATLGPCHSESPSAADPEAVASWKAWKSLDKMSRKEAMQQYVSALTTSNPNWERWVDNYRTSGTSTSTERPNSDTNTSNKLLFVLLGFIVLVAAISISWVRSV